jgi:hypothetical protein
MFFNIIECWPALYFHHIFHQFYGCLIQKPPSLCTELFSLFCQFDIIVNITEFSLTVQDIIRLPRLFRFLQRPLAKLISTFRAPKSKEGYASIGGGSPLRKITDEQVKFTRLTILNLLFFYSLVQDWF